MTSDYINKKVLVRTKHAGVFYGTLASHVQLANLVELKDCRRIWYWSGAASLHQLAAEGTKKPYECCFSMTVDSIMLSEAIEIIPCTEEAIKSIEEVHVWKI